MNTTISQVSPVILPQELVDQIIDHLYEDIPTLLQTSLVCHAWLPTSRMHIFSKVTLDPPRFRESYELCARRPRLHVALESNPELAHYIHDLRICAGSHCAAAPLAISTSATDSSSPAARLSSDCLVAESWIFTDKGLPALLKMLTNLHRFEFTSDGHLPWEELPFTLRETIEALFHLPSLAYVRLQSWDFANLACFSSLLSNCSSNLKGLSLWGIILGCDEDDADGVLSSEFAPGDQHTSDDGGEDESEDESEDEDDHDADRSPDDHDSPVVGTSDSRLETLALDYIECRYLARWLLTQTSTMNMTFNNVRELRIAHSNDYSVDFLFRAVGNSLERLHIKPGPLGLRPLDLSQNSGLRSIYLTLDEDLALEWVTNLISSIPTPDILESVAIELFIDPKRLQGWAGLDKVLSGSVFCALRQVKIGIFAHPTHAEFVKVQEELSGLKSRGPDLLRIYQLGTKRQRLSSGLTPRDRGL